MVKEAGNLTIETLYETFIHVGNAACSVNVALYRDVQS